MPHDGTWLRDDLIAQYRRESARTRERAPEPEAGSKTEAVLDLIDASWIPPGLTEGEQEFWRAKAAQRQYERDGE